jgi:hypothetical protein
MRTLREPAAGGAPLKTPAEARTVALSSTVVRARWPPFPKSWLARTSPTRPCKLARPRSLRQAPILECFVVRMAGRSARRPAYSVRCPACSVRHPAYSARRPAYSARRPAYSARRPAYSARRPAYSARRPAYSARRPAYSARHPAYSARHPAYSVRRPAFSVRRPANSVRHPAHKCARANHRVRDPIHCSHWPIHHARGQRTRGKHSCRDAASRRRGRAALHQAMSSSARRRSRLCDAIEESLLDGSTRCVTPSGSEGPGGWVAPINTLLAPLPLTGPSLPLLMKRPSSALRAPSPGGRRLSITQRRAFHLAPRPGEGGRGG